MKGVRAVSLFFAVCFMAAALLPLSACASKEESAVPHETVDEQDAPVVLATLPPAETPAPTARGRAGG